VAQTHKTTYDSTAAASSHTVTFGWTATLNRLLIACLNLDNVISTIDAGWTQAANAANFTAAYIYYKIAAGTETSLTFTMSGANPAQAVVFEYDNNLTSAVLDLALGNTDVNSPFSTGPITTTHADDLIITMMTTDASVTTNAWSALSAAYTQESNSHTTGGTVFDYMITGSRIVSATGSQSATATYTVNTSFAGVIAAFKLNAPATDDYPASPHNLWTTRNRRVLLAR
jgi:hypothetical protein